MKLSFHSGGFIRGNEQHLPVVLEDSEEEDCTNFVTHGGTCNNWSAVEYEFSTNELAGLLGIPHGEGAICEAPLDSSNTHFYLSLLCLQLISCPLHLKKFFHTDKRAWLLNQRIPKITKHP